MASGNESRRDIRKSVNIEVEFEGLKKPVKAVTQNISLGGMFVATKKPLAQTKKAFFKIKTGKEFMNFNMEGEVIWNNGRGCAKNRKDFPAGMGIRFVDSRILSKDAIKNFIAFIEASNFNVCV